MAKQLKVTSRADNAHLQVLMDGQTQCHECLHTYISEDEPLTHHECEQCEARVMTPCNLGKYWLFSRIGGGGMGQVYTAYHEARGHLIYAVKLAPHHPDFQDKMEEALRNEYRIMSQLGEHPSIASAHELCELGDKVFVVMDYINGERLDLRVRRLGQLSEFEAALLAMRLISAEVHVFRRGYVFRDMKPENVILTGAGAVLYDFGICMTCEKALEDPGDLIEGSPMYMPPERLTGEGEGVRSEVYSMGMVLYFALTGETLIQGTASENTAAKHVEQSRVSDILQKRPELHAQWEPVLDKMIARQAPKRYQTFTELERDFTSIFSALAKQYGFNSLHSAIADILLPTGTLISQFQHPEDGGKVEPAAADQADPAPVDEPAEEVSEEPSAEAVSEEPGTEEDAAEEGPEERGSESESAEVIAAAEPEAEGEAAEEVAEEAGPEAECAEPTEVVAEGSESEGESAGEATGEDDGGEEGDGGESQDPLKPKTQVSWPAELAEEILGGEQGEAEVASG